MINNFSTYLSKSDLERWAKICLRSSPKTNLLRESQMTNFGDLSCSFMDVICDLTRRHISRYPPKVIDCVRRLSCTNELWAPRPRFHATALSIRCYSCFVPFGQMQFEMLNCSNEIIMESTIIYSNREPKASASNLPDTFVLFLQSHDELPRLSAAQWSCHHRLQNLFGNGLSFPVKPNGSVISK